MLFFFVAQWAHEIVATNDSSSEIGDCASALVTATIAGVQKMEQGDIIDSAAHSNPRRERSTNLLQRVTSFSAVQFSSSLEHISPIPERNLKFGVSFSFA